MNYIEELRETNKLASRELLDIKALLEALIIIDQASYPSISLAYIAKEKLIKVFNNIEQNRIILKKSKKA